MGLKAISLLLAVASLAAAAWFGASGVRLLAQGTSVEGRVVKVEKGKRLKGGEATRPRYTAHIAFDAGGPRTIQRSWSEKAGSTCFAGCYQEGEILKLRYLPGDPAGAEVDSLGRLLGLPAALALFGAAWGAVFFWLRRRAR